MWSSYIGLTWSVISLAVTFGGFPHQIYVNYKEKKAGMSPVLIAAAMLSYAFGSLYGLAKPDHFIAVMQAPAFVLVSVIAFQAVIYRSRA